MSTRRRGLIVMGILLLAYGGYRVWWTPAIGGEPAIGTVAPNFTLRDQHGNTVTLLDECRKQPVIVTFYRGFW